MADTLRGDYPDAVCNDCKGASKEMVGFIHWGPLVPAGERGKFCGPCWITRQQYYRTHGKAMPLPAPAPPPTTANPPPDGH